MRDALDRLPLERALQLTLAALLLFTVLSQGALLSWLSTAQKLKWAALCAFAALAVAYALRRAAQPRLSLVHAWGAGIVALALASTTWSAFPRVTFERAAAFALLAVACGALAAVADARAARAFLDAIVAGALAVAVGGLLVLAFDHDRAVQPATSALAARYQGLGGGPNTAMMLLAVAVPPALLVGLGGTAVRRAVGIAATLLFAGSIVASGSRGALLAAFAGAFVVAVTVPRPARARALAGAAVLALLVVAALITRIPQPHAGAPPLPSASEPPPTVFHGPRKTVSEPPPRLQDDVGRPPYGIGETTRKPRTLFGSSGRAQAWDGAVHLGAERPLVGYGFGTEDRVFLDRYADFNSNVPENSYIGLFLQLGVVGLAAVVALLAWAVVRGLARPQDRALVAALAGVVVGGLVLAAFQSYLYAVGNNATAAVWLSVFLLAALAPAALPRLRLLLAAAAVVLVAAVVGNVERAHRADAQSTAMEHVLGEIGALDSPQLDQYRYLSSAFQCLLYRRGRDPFALELCADRDGRVVETVDRRTAPEPRIHSLRDDPARSHVQVDRKELTRLLHAMGVPLDLLPPQ